MQTIIDNAIDQVNQGTEWVLTNAKVEKKKSYKNLVKERRVLKKIRRTCGTKATVVLYGQSQCGKSHLSSSLLSADGKPMRVQDRVNAKSYEFLTHLNPPGSGEATGLITRFTTQPQPDVTADFPVHLKLMSVKDIVLMLCDGYYRDIERREPFSEQAIKRVLDELRSHKSTTRQQYIDEDAIGEMEEYFRNFSQDLYYALSADATDYFGELSLMIEYLPEEDVLSALNVFWNNDPCLSRVFRQLFNACKSVEFASDAYISFGELNNAQGKTLLYVGWLDLKDTQTRSQIRFKSPGGAFKTTFLPKTDLAAICAEVILEVVPLQMTEGSEKAGYIRTILENVDILDFPGARGRGGILTTSGFESVLLRRGKVGYYFNKYSSERMINSLLFCWEPNNFDAKPMEGVLRNWVDIAIGRDQAERAVYLEGMNVAPLFFVGTKFNLHLQSKTDDRADNPNALSIRWEKWFEEQLSKDIIGVPTDQNGSVINDNFKWFESWTDDSPCFDNCYLLRDFRYSTNIYDGWTEESGMESARKPEPYAGFYQKLKESFINHPFVEKHFRDASQRWDEASDANCDGSLPIARNLSSIVEKISAAARGKNMRDIKEAVSNIKAELNKHYYSTDTEAALKKALVSAARLQASLDIAFGRDPYYFGRFMKAMTITEYAVHEAFSDIFATVGEAGNIGDYVYIYMRAPEIKPSNSFNNNLSILRTAYGFSNDEECRQYFVDNLHIDLEDLFRRSEFGLQSPSQMLAATLKNYWFEGWLRGTQHDYLCKMLGDSSFEEMVDMLYSLFEKYDVERRVAQTIHKYVDTFGIDVKELSEMIADICAEMINKFVLSVGYDYYSKEDGVVDNLKEASRRQNIALNFSFVDEKHQAASNDHIAGLMAQIDDVDRIREMLMNPSDHSIDDLSAVIPGFRQSCRWRDLAKVGFVLTNDIPHYDVEANKRLGTIIDNCNSLIK